MKREIIAVIILIIIPIAAFVNVRYFTKTTDSLIAEIDTAESQAYSGDMEGAKKSVEESLQTWISKESYVHVFMTHDSLEGTTEAYYTLLAGIQSGDAQPALFDTVRASLRSIREIERLKISSIF